MFFYEVCDAFYFARVPFVVVGGYAMALHGMVRATMGVDVVLNLKLEDFEKAERALGGLGLKSRIPVDLRICLILKILKGFLIKKIIRC